MILGSNPSRFLPLRLSSSLGHRSVPVLALRSEAREVVPKPPGQGSSSQPRSQPARSGHLGVVYQHVGAAAVGSAAPVQQEGAEVTLPGDQPGAKGLQRCPLALRLLLATVGAVLEPSSCFPGALGLLHPDLPLGMLPPQSLHCLAWKGPLRSSSPTSSPTPP